MSPNSASVTPGVGYPALLRDTRPISEFHGVFEHQRPRTTCEGGHPEMEPERCPRSSDGGTAQESEAVQDDEQGAPLVTHDADGERHPPDQSRGHQSPDHQPREPEILQDYP